MALRALGLFRQSHRGLMYKVLERRAEIPRLSEAERARGFKLRSLLQPLLEHSVVARSRSVREMLGFGSISRDAQSHVA